MGKRPLSKEEQDALKPLYPRIHNLRELCFAGFDYDLLERDTVSPFVAVSLLSPLTFCAVRRHRGRARSTLREALEAGWLRPMAWRLQGLPFRCEG
jgi:hypothetical protein